MVRHYSTLRIWRGPASKNTVAAQEIRSGLCNIRLVHFREEFLRIQTPLDWRFDFLFFTTFLAAPIFAADFRPAADLVFLAAFFARLAVFALARFLPFLGGAANSGTGIAAASAASGM